jgi:hypothetical protein
MAMDPVTAIIANRNAATTNPPTDNLEAAILRATKPLANVPDKFASGKTAVSHDAFSAAGKNATNAMKIDV